jgi:polyisoprenoid-binding protein YceI
MRAMPSHDLSGDYTLDVDKTRIEFIARHALITKVRGHFNEFSASAHLDFDDPTRSHAEITVQAASIDTHNAIRDSQLRANDFLDVPAHPLITYFSTSVEQVDDTHFDVTGDLAIKATTRPVTVRFELKRSAEEPDGTVRVGFKGSATVNRRDWKLEWAAPLEAGGVLVGDKVSLEVEVSAIKARS